MASVEELRVPEELKKTIVREHLDGLIGRTHLLILESLEKGDKTRLEVFNEIKGRWYITAPTQVIRATDQLKRINCIEEVGKKRVKFVEAEEAVCKITDKGRILLRALKEIYGEVT